MDYQQVEIKRAFKGVWIPAVIWDSNNLTLLEKCVLAEIDSLDDGEGCFASNEYLGKKFSTSERNMANIISRLRKKGFIIDRSFDGRVRKISTTFSSNCIKNELSQNKDVKADFIDSMKSDFIESMNPLYIEKKEEKKVLSLAKKNFRERGEREFPSLEATTERKKPTTEKGWRDLRRLEAGKSPTITRRTKKQNEAMKELTQVDDVIRKHRKMAESHGEDYSFMDEDDNKRIRKQIALVIPKVEKTGKTMDEFLAYVENNEFAKERGYNPLLVYTDAMVIQFLIGKQKRDRQYKKGVW